MFHPATRDVCAKAGQAAPKMARPSVRLRINCFMEILIVVVSTTHFELIHSCFVFLCFVRVL